MRRMDKGFALILAFLLVIQPLQLVRAEGEPDYGKHFTFYDEIPVMLIGEPESGKILFEKGIHEKLPVASMSKIMTYLIVCEAVEKGEIALSDQVTISDAAAAFNNWESSNYGLKAGMKKTVSDLLDGLMVVSGNDAAVALAEHVSGTEAAFVQRMNDRAAELGLTESHFINSNGFTVDGEMNQMSAKDLFTLSAEIIRRFPEVKDFVKIRVIEEREREYVSDSTLKPFIEEIPGTLGIKTGTTDEAGYCFTGLFDLSKTNPQVDFDVVTVVMGADDLDQRWRTTKELVDFAAGSFAHRQLVDASIPVMRYDLPTSEEGSIVLYPAESFSTITYAHAIPDVRYEIYEEMKAPTPAEKNFGVIYIYQNEQPIKKIDIVAHKETKAASLGVRAQRSMEYFFNFLVQLFQ